MIWITRYVDREVIGQECEEKYAVSKRNEANRGKGASDRNDENERYRSKQVVRDSWLWVDVHEDNDVNRKFLKVRRSYVL